METPRQSRQAQIVQAQEELELEIRDLPNVSEAAGNRWAWIGQKLLHWQRSLHPRSGRLIGAGVTLLLALVASLVIFSSLRPVTSSLLIATHPGATSVSSDPANSHQYPLKVYRGHVGAVLNIAWSPDGTRLAAGGHDATIQIWDALTGKLLMIYRGHSNEVLGMAWSPDGTRIASVSRDATAQVWDARTGRQLFIYRNQNSFGAIYSVAWSPDSTRIVFGEGDGLTQVWDVIAGKHMLTYNLMNSRAVLSVTWSPDVTSIGSTS